MIAWMQARAAPIIATILFGAPLLAFVLVIALVKGHASVAYYEAVSQIIPVVVLALAIELRYFSPNRQLPAALKARFRHPERAQPLAAGYAVATLLALIASEAIALAVVASESLRPPRPQHHRRRPGRRGLRPGRGDFAARRRRSRFAGLRPTSIGLTGRYLNHEALVRLQALHQAAASSGAGANSRSGSSSGT